MRTIMFVFGGRELNIRLALPFYERILEENPDVEIHLWDLARDPADSKYMRSIKMDRLIVCTQYYNPARSARGQVKVWRHYAQPEYQDCLFVKTDDDCVFYDTNHFKDFVAAIQPGDVLSALVVNNGASTRHIPGIWDMYQDLDIPLDEAAQTDELKKLLNVHASAEYAERSHRWFFDNWQTLTSREGTVVPTQDWVSINTIGMRWDTVSRIAGLLDSRPPREIAGRFYTFRNRVGDEGAANMLRRRIHTGFTVGHVGFGPQLASPSNPHGMSDGLVTELLKLYEDVGRHYLADNTFQVESNT